MEHDPSTILIREARHEETLAEVSNQRAGGTRGTQSGNPTQPTRLSYLLDTSWNDCLDQSSKYYLPRKTAQAESLDSSAEASSLISLIY